MSKEQAHISNVKGSTIGVILVLFILLVIVTAVFYVRPTEDDGPIGGLSTRTFSIYNNTSAYTLYATSVSSYATPISQPPDILYPNGGLNQYNVTASGSKNVTRRAPIVYDVRDEAGVSVGTLQFTLRVRRGGLGSVTATIVDVSTTAPINWSVSELILTLTNPILF
ncbi:hypothetical protein M3223_12010 [Paenibacillus pasadenensis]|uniref:hypothetical protein n=1 Tax=Paenibacillus pasadenensis TaxID=217090 RepID=UPI00203CDC8A|nr:hypothetical protein [Paenibacillus pasadenensis]MCM3748078.1 hypothetical protein [Paenibacillus pasadenensis]